MPLTATLRQEVVRFAGVAQVAFRTEHVGIVREMLSVAIDTPGFGALV